MPPAVAQTEPAELQIDHLGLIAGKGAFPVMIARAARSRSIAVTAFAFRGQTSPDLESEVDSMHWMKLGQIDKAIRTLHDHGVSKITLAGQIKHNSIFDVMNVDKRGMKMIARLRNLKADSILNIVTDELEAENIEVLDSTLFLRSCMPAAGLLTPSAPASPELMRDIEFGLEEANAIAGLDIGQTVVVKSLSVVAVEAMEGTDACILRAGQLAGEGVVVAKVAKPNQDSRFDVPVVGLGTVRNMIKVGASALAFPGGKVLFFDQEAALALAEENGITILAV